MSLLHFIRSGSTVKVPVNLTAGQDFKIVIDYNGTPPTQVSNPLGGAGMTNDTSPTWGRKLLGHCLNLFLLMNGFHVNKI